MSRAAGSKGWRVPPGPVMARGVELVSAGAVKSAVFQVETGSGRALVHEEVLPDGGVDLACSCPARGGCEHVAAVIAYLGANAPLIEAGALTGSLQAAVDAESDRMHSGSGLTIAPPASAIDLAMPCLHEDPAAARRVADLLGRILRVAAERGVEGGRDELLEATRALERELDGVIAPDVARVASDVRSLALGAVDDPARACTIVERASAVISVLQDAGAPGAEPARELSERLETAFLGRKWSFDDAVREEDVALLEVARTSALTPFGLRRNASYLLDLGSGRLLLEQIYERVGQDVSRSPGPFPRRIHAGLMSVMPGISPQGARLMQYIILPSPGENDLLRLKKSSLSAARDVFDLHAETCRAARGPYPVFLSFAHAGIAVGSKGRGPALMGADGSGLALAHRSSPEICASLVHLCSTHRQHCVTGLAVWDGHEIALDPLSVLVENVRGLSILRLR